VRKVRVDKIKAFFIMAFSAVFNLLGILAIPLLILLGCNIFDYYTGWKAAPKRNPDDDKPIKSYKSIRGIHKKVCMYILVILGWFVDVLVETTLAQLIPITIPPVFAITITCWLIFNEIISILENMEDAEVAIPPFLLPILKKMKGQIEEKTDTE